MSEKLRGVVVSHLGLAQALADAVAHITGEREALVPVSNEGCSLDTLGKRVVEAVGPEPCVVFVDLPGGSCLQAAAHYLRGHPGSAVVTGVNLAMVVDFVYHRDLPPMEAAKRALETGGRALKVLGR